MTHRPTVVTSTKRTTWSSAARRDEVLARKVNVRLVKKLKVIPAVVEMKLATRMGSPSSVRTV
jgi:hypothetical protein